MRTQHLKIIVAGRIGSGKSMFIRSIDETEVIRLVYGWKRSDYANYLEIEEGKRNSKKSAGIETGHVTVDDDLSFTLHSASSNLSSISSIPRGMHGFLVLVDSTDERSFYEARALLLYMFHFPRVPYIVVANKQDLEGALTVEQVRQKMRLPDHVSMMDCISKERDSVRNVLLELLYKILPDSEA